MPEGVVKLLLVFAGGGLGCISRYGLNALGAVLAATFPLGTLLANVIGCFTIGVLGFFFHDRPVLTPNHRLLLITGFLGGLTTFSSFGYETIVLIQRRDYGAASINVGANLVFGLAAVWLGWAAARAIWA